jgi:hypothetical protein
MPLAEEAQVQLYDSMDKSNNTAATECLLDSISPELKKRIQNWIADQILLVTQMKNLVTHQNTPFRSHNTNSYVELFGITPKQHQNEPTQTEQNASAAIPQGQIQAPEVT